MDRLTYRLGEQNPTYGLEDKASSKIGLFTDYDGFYAHLLAVNRLGQYEDTGLLPGDVMDLQAICKENGLAEYVDVIVEAKRQISKDNENSIVQDEQIATLQAEITTLQAKLDKAVEDMNHIATKIATSKDILSGRDKLCDLALGRCDVCTKSCHTEDGCKFKWRGLEGRG